MPGKSGRLPGRRKLPAREAALAAELRRGLTARLPSIPSKHFYDDRGSRLFDRITTLPEYYLTRTEQTILEGCADQVIERVRPAELVELGSGLSRKVRILLDAMAGAGLLRRCLLLDINERFLRQAVRRLAADYPGLSARGLVGDFEGDLDGLGPGGERLAAFLGGTIGNLHPDRGVPPFLARLAGKLGPGDGLLLGVDLVKGKARLEAAYNDAAGVTARFNLNILRSVNERFGANFDPRGYAHVAFYDEDRAWIEMRLRAKWAMRVEVPAAGLSLALRRGDEIRTEISCKYTRASLEKRCRGTGLSVEEWFTDRERLFALALLMRSG